MKKRLLQIRVILLIITGSISCWFSYQAIKESFKFIRLNSQVSAQLLDWEIKMLSPSNYTLFAAYRYCVNGQDFTGQTLFSSPSYMNYYAAENDLKAKKYNHWVVWYQKNQPSFSSLQKRFPKKECTNAFVTLGVFIYFYFVKGLLERNSEN